MCNLIIRRCSVTPLGLVICLLVGSTIAAAQNRVLEISLPHFAMGADESVQQVNCELLGGAITRLNIPYGWSVNLDMDASADGHGKLSASSQFFSGGLNDLAYFDNFITIETMPETKGLALPPPRDLDVTVLLTIGSTRPTGPIYRKLRFTKAQLRLHAH